MKKFLFIFAAFAGFFLTAQSELNWTKIESLEKNVAKEKRLIVIDVYTDWCGWCKKMDKNTYANPKVADYLNKKFYAVKFDAEQKEPIDFKGHTFQYVAQGRSGYNQLAPALLNGKMSFPSTVFMNENLEIIQVLPGYLDAKQMYKILVYLGEEHYLNTPWQEFEKNFKE